MSKGSAKPFKNLSACAAKAADDKKGEDIVLLHIHPISALADYLLIVSINSPSHMDSVEEKIEDSLKSQGVSLRHRDGKASELWRVLDYGGLIVHLMHPSAREFYNLEKLYRDAHKVHWNGEHRRSNA